MRSVVVVAAALSLVGCTGSEGPEPVPSRQATDDRVIEAASRLTGASGEPSKLPQFQTVMECLVQTAPSDSTPNQEAVVVLQLWEMSRERASLLDVAERECKKRSEP